MKRFFLRLVRFFWSWGFLKFVLVAITLIILLYAEEDWRGARELAAEKQRWLDAGYSLNPADYYPPPVPDDQNLAALPIFQLERDPEDPKHPNWLWDLRLRAALDEDKHGGDFYRDAYKAKVYVDKVALNVHFAYAKMFPGKVPPVSSLAQLEELYPIVTDLRTAARARPVFRLNQNYAFEPVWERPLGLVVDQIKLAKLFSCHAQLALRENQPAVAVEDIAIGLEIARGVGKDPTLVGGLVSLGVSAITRNTIDEGLATHAWNDAQLVQIQAALQRPDFLALYRLDMCSECAVFAMPIFEALKTNPSLMNLMLGNFDQGNKDASIGVLLAWRLWASGWWDINAARMADFYRRESLCVDTNAQLIERKLNDQIYSDLMKAKELPGGAAPWNILYAVSAGATVHVVEQFAQGQVKLDEDRIVCGIERYRLAHAGYPATLDVLAPAYIDAVPHDIMKGEPYHYRLNADGTFLLYSVGWNQTDDGGKVVYKQYTPPAIDYEQGDWVWPMVKR